MSLREFALAAYYHTSYPYRQRLQRQANASGNAPLCVLFYHRVADQHPNDWTISNRAFQRQMLWLKKHFDLISLDEVQARMERGENRHAAVAITFDDGYAENCDQAIPFLVDHQIPATYFVALDFVANQRPFPHDEQNHCPLPVNTPDQIRQMSKAGIEIGSHTRNHCDVGAITDVETMVDEIQTATLELADLAQQPIRHFAFPFGKVNNLSAAAAHLAKEIGITGVCSAYGAYNFPGQDPFHVQRIHGDPEFVRLRNWLTMDPRKLNLGRGEKLPESPVASADVLCLDSRDAEKKTGTGATSSSVVITPNTAPLSQVSTPSRHAH